MADRLVSLPPMRQAQIDLLTFAARLRAMLGLLEVDVTRARQIMRERRAEGEDLSFTAFAVACLARTVIEHPEVQGLPAGRTRVLVFDDVDVSVQIERRAEGRLLVVLHVVRAAQAKSPGGSPTRSEPPWVVDGKARVREVLHLCLSIDHDVVDGAPATRFARRLADLPATASLLPDLGPKPSEEGTFAAADPRPGPGAWR
ncbi:2-oxo acid dehydrogenase subunit E2 [Thermoactinospora rubra]|uniref:2-oxo acid dehydrogenase subunit E2 n=1 Tax=Thermoactinospora rubra TaxID=1088767 RepID=UPI000A11619B|nr:2-oxo acid dehydrogenase subunit E2 [Thermoactinospora rubra]